MHPFRLPDGRHAIPGSSIKGMLRAVVEIAGFGRMRMVDDVRPGLRDITGTHVKDAYIQRVRDKIQTGLMKRREDGSAEITPCRMVRLPHDVLKQAMGVSSRIFETGMSVSDKYCRWKDLCAKRGWNPRVLTFDLNGREIVRLGRGSIHGVPVFTGQIHGKKKDFVFYAPDENRKFPVDDTDWRDFLAVHGNDKSGEEAKSLSWPGYWKSIYMDGGEVPVFYIMDGKRVRIGLAYMPKLAGDFSTHDCIRNACKDHLNTDPETYSYDLADLLFGCTIGDNHGTALRGRISFEPAVVLNTSQEEEQEPTILNAPKPSYFPNYLKQQVDDTGLRLAERSDAQYSTYVHSARNRFPILRGFKRYPARPSNMVGIQPLTEDQEKNKNVQVLLHTLRRGTKFEGRIHFHNLKREELGALLWSMTWGGNKDMCHGLGMGKPFGFGQVRFMIDTEASRLLPNDPSKDAAILDNTLLRSMIDVFERHMECVAEKHGGWRNSPQIRNLLAMADPESANSLPMDMTLRHMRIMRCQRNGKRENANEFVWAEQKGLVLADYANATGWSGDITKRQQHKDQSGDDIQELLLNTFHPWLQEQLKEVLEISHANSIEALMRHNLLFKKWKTIKDKHLKKEIYEVIKAFWEKNGWWENPDNKSMRQLRNKYEREVRKS
ncbi:TIGR03986 family CRISPR-associated RAMP protein [Candidatus Parcubacteria bacterium]|nr:MAG: TIGR03986 family CRISPR-associated RAMP protein [Candidatus Parcubacteria bacterium]